MSADGLSHSCMNPAACVTCLAAASPSTPAEQPQPDERIYLHTWGSRRHIADTVYNEGNGFALCGQRGYTEVARFRGSVPSRRKRAGIVNRPVCSNCVAIVAARPSSGTDAAP